MEIMLSELKSLRKNVIKFRSKIKKDKKWGFNDSWEYFTLGMVLLQPSSYGPRIANRFSQENKLIKSDDKDRGDVKDKNGIYYEKKASILQDLESVINIVQIRPWQNVDYYIIACDIRNDEFKMYVFKLTHEQMRKEIELIGQVAHGTKRANSNNQNQEYRMSIEPESKHFQRWINNYLI